MQATEVGVTEAIARWIGKTTYEDMPPEAVEAAKRAILDTLGVSLAGATQPVGQIVLNYTREAGGTPEAGVIGGGLRTNVADAAFANGVLSHATDYDDTWLPVGHPSCTVFPVILALGEKLGASGRELIEAFVIGLEVHGKVGFGHSTPGFHSTAIYGVLGAAAAGSKLLGLDEWKTRMALAIAASHASGVGKNNGTMTKPYHAGNAASGGLRAALLAKAGFNGDPDILGPRGYTSAFMKDSEYDPQATIAGLGNPFHVVSPGIAVKKYPTCYLNHRALDAILRLVVAHDVRPEQVEEVVVTVPYEGWLNRTDLDFGLRAKFSMQYNMVEAILSRKVIIESFDDTHVFRPEAQEMMRRVRLEEDTSIPKEYENASNPVTLRLNDGRVLSERVDVPHGDWDDLLSLEELVAKYRDNALRVLSSSDSQRTTELVLGLEKVEDIKELAGLYIQPPNGKNG